MSTFTGRHFTDVFADAREELNDSTGDRYPDARLLTHAASTHAEIESEYAKRDINLLEKMSSAFSYVANATTIAIPGGITDLNEPLLIWQRLNSADPWSEVPRRNMNNAPPVLNPQYLQSWEWSGNVINVNPGSQDLELLVRYRRTLDYPTANSTVDFENIYWPLVYGTAYRAARRTKRADIVQDLKTEYYKRLQDAVLHESRQMQGDGERWRGNRDRMRWSTSFPTKF